MHDHLTRQANDSDLQKIEPFWECYVLWTLTSEVYLIRQSNTQSNTHEASTALNKNKKQGNVSRPFGRNRTRWSKVKLVFEALQTDGRENSIDPCR